MTLMEAWKDSLQLCKPQAMKMILLVTLNAMRQAVKVLCALWFLVPLFLMIGATLALGSIKVGLVAYSFALSAAFLAMRPSINIKNWGYFTRYFGTLFLFIVELALWGFAITTILALWELLFVPFGHIHSFLATKKFVFGPINYLATAPAYCAGIVLYVAYIMHFIYYAGFFYLDKVGSAFTACKKALTLICYNLPMILVYTGIMWAVKLSVQVVGSYCLVKLMVFTNSMALQHAWIFFFAVIDFVTYLFSFALISNIYTKRVHDQYSLYQ